MNDPKDEIRSDLWLSMTTEQLDRQRDLVITKLSAVSNMLSYATPAIHSMHFALNMALQDLNGLIDSRSSSR